LQIQVLFFAMWLAGGPTTSNQLFTFTPPPPVLMPGKAPLPPPEGVGKLPPPLPPDLLISGCGSQPLLLPPSLFTGGAGFTLRMLLGFIFLPVLSQLHGHMGRLIQVLLLLS
jgi:hypothetical protein